MHCSIYDFILNAIFHLRYVAINSEFGSSVCRLIYLSKNWIWFASLPLPKPNSMPQSIANRFGFSWFSYNNFFCFYFVCAILHLVSRTTGNFTPHDEHCCNFAATHHLIHWNFFQLLFFFIFVISSWNKKALFSIYPWETESYKCSNVHHFGWMVTVVSSSN